MGASYLHYSSRIANASRAWQAVCETNKADWDKSNEFIIAMVATTDTHSGDSSQFKLQWGVGEAPSSWSDLAASGAMKFGSNTVLVDGTTPIEEANRSGCHQGTLEDSDENEGDGTTTLLATTAKDNCVEAQFAVNPADAADGETYSFRLYDITVGAALGVAGASIVILAGATQHYQTVEDKAGLVDTTVKVWAGHKTVSDIGGLVDSAMAALATSQTVADLAGLLDSVAVKWGMSETVTELAGLVDSVSYRADYAEAASEIAGLVDSIEFKGTYTESTTDIAGLLDSVGIVHTPAGGGAQYQTVSDISGLVDAVVVVHTPAGGSSGQDSGYWSYYHGRNPHKKEDELLAPAAPTVDENIWKRQPELTLEERVRAYLLKRKRDD